MIIFVATYTIWKPLLVVCYCQNLHLGRKDNCLIPLTYIESFIIPSSLEFFPSDTIIYFLRKMCHKNQYEIIFIQLAFSQTVGGAQNKNQTENILHNI